MEYPGTKFTRPIRLGLLIFFLAAFFITAPVLIMYTAGYRYDWQHGLLKETGSINIDIEPKTATAYLNNVRLQEKLPIRMNNIVPAKYNLRLTAPGYFDWNKEIEIKNKQTNYTKEISLIKKNKPEIFIKEKVRDFAISYDGRFIIYATAKNSGLDVWLLDNTTQQKSFIYSLPLARTIDMHWAENNYYLTISDIEKPYTLITVIDAENPQKQTQLVVPGLSILKLQWSSTAEPQLYYSTHDSIFLFSAATKKTQLISQNKYLDWYMENGQLWTMAMASPTQLFQITKDTLGFSSAFKQITHQDLNAENQDQYTSANLEIAAARNNTVLIKASGHANMILATNNNTYEIPAEQFLISKYNNWWLLWSDWELWTYSQGEQPNLLNRSGEQLNQILPLDRYNTLALIWKNKTTVLFPYYFVSHDLMNIKVTQPAVDTENKILYFIDKDEDGIWKLIY